MFVGSWLKTRVKIFQIFLNLIDKLIYSLDIVLPADSCVGGLVRLGIYITNTVAVTAVS